MNNLNNIPQGSPVIGPLEFFPDRLADVNFIVVSFGTVGSEDVIVLNAEEPKNALEVWGWVTCINTEHLVYWLLALCQGCHKKLGNNCIGYIHAGMG